MYHQYTAQGKKPLEQLDETVGGEANYGPTELVSVQFQFHSQDPPPKSQTGDFRQTTVWDKNFNWSDHKQYQVFAISSEQEQLDPFDLFPENYY